MAFFRKILDALTGNKSAKPDSPPPARRQDPPPESDEPDDPDEADGADGAASREPITIFSRIADPLLVVRRLRELCDAVAVDGPDDAWSEATVTFTFEGKARKLTFTHSPDYYAEPNWSRQMSGMRGFLSTQFPTTDRQQRVLMLTTTFRFSLGTMFEPDFDSDGDPRLDVLYAVTDALDGVLFTPSSIRDRDGRILYGLGGEDEEDPNAKWPRVAAEAHISDPVGAAAHDASRPVEEGEEVDRSEAPSPERVARRAAALAAVTYRAILEQEPPGDEIEESRRDLIAWVGDVGVDDELEPDEWKVLQRPVGKLDQRSQVDATWRLEALGVLAWALKRFEVPPHDQLVETGPLWRSLGLLDAELGRKLLADVDFRSPDEIRVLRNRVFALHWRLRNYSVRPEVTDFAEFARTAWFGPLDISELPLVEGDLAIHGERIDRATPDARGTAHSAAMERHRAVNWLWNGPERFSEADDAT